MSESPQDSLTPYRYQRARGSARAYTSGQRDPLSLNVLTVGSGWRGQGPGMSACMAGIGAPTITEAEDERAGGGHGTS